jgi:hypothetical protein
MPPALQFFPQFKKVEYLAIEHHLNRAVLIVNGLAPTFQVDDAQAGMRQADGTLQQETVAIGAAVPKRMNHPFQLLSGRCWTMIEVQYAGYSTHGAY